MSDTDWILCTNLAISNTVTYDGDIKDYVRASWNAIKMRFNGHLITAKLCYILYNHSYDRRILSFFV